MSAPTVRARLESALAGEPVDRPAYLVYDWFVRNRPLDWETLFDRGLGQLAHVELVRVERPNLSITEESTEIGGRTHKAVRWITDRGELEETFVDGWQQTFLVKRSEDYTVLRRAFEDTVYTADSAPFHESEAALGDRGFTVGSLGWTPIRRTPLLQVMVDFAGPERFAVDYLDRVPSLTALLDLLRTLTLDKLRQAVGTDVKYIKLWENLAIEMLGVRAYREYMVPLYREMLEIASAAGKRLLVHYDGKLGVIADDIAGLDFDLDSLTPPPEGDMTIAEARAAWGDKFFWMHPPLGWFHDDRARLASRIREMLDGAGRRHCCLMISEDVPHDAMETVPFLLDTFAANE